MEKMNEEKILALVPSAVCDTAPIYKKSTQILPQVLHTQNTEKSEEQEMSILPSFQHIVTCYLAIIKTDYINTFIDYVKDKCNHIESMGLEGSCILRNIKRKMRRFLKFTKQHNDYVHQNLGWFQQRLFDIYITCNPYSHKTIEPPKVTTKFRPLLSVVTREAKFEESGEKFDKNTISNIVAIQDGIVTYSRHCMTICCITRNGDRNYVHCPSSVTDFTRIGQDIVLATLPFRKMILIIHPISFTIKTIQLELYLASYLEHSTLIGVEMFRKVIYLVNWDDDSIKRKIITKEIPAAIAVGPGKNILTSFSNSNEVVCYNPDGQQLFEVETHSMVLPTKLTFYQRHFYVLQGRIIYKVSATGGMKKRDIGRKCWDISVGKDIILVTDVFGIPHIIKTNKDFWPRLPYNHQLRTPSLNNHIYIEDCNSITNILPMSTSSILIIYSNKNAILFTDSGEIINQNNLTFLELPSIFCRINSNRFLVFYHEKKALQYIACPELRKGPLIKVHTDYIKICHIVSNKCLAVTTIESKNEIHILLIKEKKVDIIERISLKHNNVTIAATPVNFAVVDRREHKLVFYATSGEELFEKCLPFYGDPHHIYSDNVYFYVLFKRQSIVICYDIYGVIKWQWKLPLPVHPHIAIFQGTVYVLDIEHNRVLLYKYQNRSSGCYLHTKNPYIRHLNLRLKEKENDKKLVIAKICHLANGELVVSDINSDCLLYISKGGDIVSKLSLPSTSTDIRRWDSNQIGVTLPLEKQLRVIGNLSKTIRTVSLSQPYVLVCKLGKGQIVCYCDKASGFDILAIKNYNQVEIIHRINFPFVGKSLAIENETLNLLIVTGKKAFRYNTTFSGGGRCFSSFKMVPSVLLSQVKYPPNLYGGSIDKMFVYLIDNSRMFAINDHNLLVNDLVTNNQLNIYIDMVDVFSRNICVSEMLSSTIYQQDLTVSDKARRVHLPQLFGDENPVEIYRLVITENNLIAGYDDTNKNIKIFTFDGQLLDSIKMDANYDIKMCRGQSNTLVIMMKNYEYQLVVLKVEFPLSLVVYQTRNKYDCVASLSNNQLVCSCWNDKRSLYVVDVDEIHSTVNETLLTKGKQDYRNYITKIQYIKVTADNVIIALDKHFIIFFNSDGQHLHSFRHYMEFHACDDNITTDDSYLYTYGQWDKYHSLTEYKNIVCLTQTGEYSRVFLNQRIYKEKLFFPTINCKGPRFVGSRCEKNELYVEGYFMINREKIPISRLLTDKCPVQVKDIDISDEGKTVVCEQANNGNVKIFDKDGKLLCYRNVASLVGGVCFTQESHIMATVPKRKEIFQLQEQDLEKNKGWPSQVPYGILSNRNWRICLYNGFRKQYLPNSCTYQTAIS
ncbi:uncharacterized protein LOC115225796 [Octopus sinensis]|uniref:Uncharacterized protein LOC115225796 n=1 Tax=Octopus sinensis TaxID=2607531 RepID=A0A7E6FS17_9MOLL|nr:uncharacterized protein LOC115225796 [Octopus sinensis]